MKIWNTLTTGGTPHCSDDQGTALPIRARLSVNTPALESANPADFEFGTPWDHPVLSPPT